MDNTTMARTRGAAARVGAAFPCAAPSANRRNRRAPVAWSDS